MKKEQFLNNMSDWNNHLLLMWLAMEETKSGDVVEYGCGDGSTKQLHNYCKASKRKLFSYDNSQEYVDQFAKLKTKTHTIESVTDWNNVSQKHQDASVVLIDHAPGERRIIDVEMLKDINGILVLHDTQPPPTGAAYGYEKIWGLFKYRVTLDAGKNPNCDDNSTWATAVSNTYDVTKWKGQMFGKYILK